MKYKITFRSILIALGLLISFDFFGQTKLYWTGAGSTNNWSDFNNWTPRATPYVYDTVVFDGRTSKNSYVDFNFTVAKLVMNGYTGEISQLGINKTLLIGNGGLLSKTGKLKGTSNNFIEIKGPVDIAPPVIFANNNGYFNAPTSRIESGGCNAITGCTENFGSCNLVKNGSFETYQTDPPLIPSGCEDFVDGYNIYSYSYAIYKSCSWTGLLTPDYYNVNYPTTGSAFTTAAPNSSETAHSGDGMAGLFAYIEAQDPNSSATVSTDARETLISALGQQVKKNKSYYISFYARLSHFSKYATGALGFLLTPKNLLYNLGSNSAGVTRVNTSTDIAVSTVGTTWTEIRNPRYKADGDKSYINISAFGATTDLGISTYNNTTAAGLAAYYYIDDVKVVPYPDLTGVRYKDIVARYYDKSSCTILGKSMHIAPKPGTIPLICAETKPFLNLTMKTPIPPNMVSITSVDSDFLETDITIPTEDGTYTYQLYDWDNLPVTGPSFNVYIIYPTLAELRAIPYASDYSNCDDPVLIKPTTDFFICDEMLNNMGLVWKDASGNILSQNSLSFIANPTVTTTYSLYDKKGNTIHSVTIVNNKPKPVISLSYTPGTGANSTVCVNKNFTLSGSGLWVDGNAQYAWDRNGVLLTANKQVVPFSNVSTSYQGTYGLVVTREGCSSVRVTKVVDISAPTTKATSNKPEYCYGETVYLYDNPGNQKSYAWYSVTTIGFGLEDNDPENDELWFRDSLYKSGIQNPVQYLLPPNNKIFTHYEYKVFSINQFNCLAIDSVSFIVHPLPIVNVTVEDGNGLPSPPTAPNVCINDLVFVAPNILGGTIGLSPPVAFDDYPASYHGKDGYMVKSDYLKSGHHKLLYIYTDEHHCTTYDTTSFNVIGKINSITAFKGSYVNGGSSPYIDYDPLYRLPTYQVCIYSYPLPNSGENNPVYNNSALNFKAYGDPKDQWYPDGDPEVGSYAKYTVKNNTSGKYLPNYFENSIVQPWYFSTEYSDNALGTNNSYTFYTEPYDKFCPSSSKPFNVFWYLPCFYCDPYNNCMSSLARMEENVKDSVAISSIYASVAPNPSINSFILSLPDADKIYTLKLYNSKGSELLKKILPSATIQFEFGNDLSPGIYLLSVHNGKDTQTIKVIKQ